MLSMLMRNLKHYINNYLLSCNKTIFSLLELIDHVLAISECFGKTLVAFYYEEKHTQSVAQICNITCVKKISSIDQVLSISGYDLENGRMPCKQNIKLKM